MTAIVGFMNPGGSSAKSTTAAAMAHLSVEAGRRVLVIDLDPQGNMTGWLGGERDTAGITQALEATATNDPARWPGTSAEEVLADRAKQVRRTIQHTEAGVDLIAADVALEDTTRRWAQRWRSEQAETLLADMVAVVADAYDVIVIDCKGDMGVLTSAALRTCTDVVGVAVPTQKSLEGLQRLAPETNRPGRARFRAVIPSQVEHRNRGGAEADDLAGLMRSTWATEVTPDVRRKTGTEAAYASGQPITAYDPSGVVSGDLRAVWEDLAAKGVLA